MNVRLQLFAVVRQLAGRDAVELALPAEATVGQLRRELVARLPQLAHLVPHLVFAVDSQYADDGARIPPGADVACIPPVSGG